MRDDELLAIYGATRQLAEGMEARDAQLKKSVAALEATIVQMRQLPVTLGAQTSKYIAAVDGKTGDVWVYGDTKDGKGFASVPVVGLGGVTQQYNPKTKRLEPYHESPSWFHPLPDNDPLGIRPENQRK